MNRKVVKKEDPVSLAAVVDVDRLVRDRVIALRPWEICSVCNVRVHPGAGHKHREKRDREVRKNSPLGKSLEDILRGASGPLEPGMPDGLPGFLSDNS